MIVDRDNTSTPGQNVKDENLIPAWAKTQESEREAETQAPDRFTLGLSILMHGLVRLPHLGPFANSMVMLFRETPLPGILVRPFALGLVFVEATVGLLLLVGLWTRWALLLGSLAMASLIFGTALRSDWNTLAIQMLYASIYAALIAAREHNAYSVDGLIER